MSHCHFIIIVYSVLQLTATEYVLLNKKNIECLWLCSNSFPLSNQLGFISNARTNLSQPDPLHMPISRRESAAYHIKQLFVCVYWQKSKTRKITRKSSCFLTFFWFHFSPIAHKNHSKSFINILSFERRRFEDILTSLHPGIFAWFIPMSHVPLRLSNQLGPTRNVFTLRK